MSFAEQPYVPVPAFIWACPPPVALLPLSEPFPALRAGSAVFSDARRMSALTSLHAVFIVGSSRRQWRVFRRLECSSTYVSRRACYAPRWVGIVSESEAHYHLF